MNILLTGGAGYIGSHVLSDLLCSGASVYVVDNFQNSSPLSLEAVRQISNRPFGNSELDLCRGADLNRLLEKVKPDAVIHFAGLKAVGESVNNPLSYYENNLCGTLELLKAMDAVGCRNIIFSSSATVYGEPQTLPIAEDHPLAPANPYGRTKLFIEEIIKDWCVAGVQKSAVILRYFNPVGAHPSGKIGESPNGTPNNLMPFMSQVAAGKREFLSVFGQDYDTADGTGIRDYIHVSDLAAGHIAALRYSFEHSGVNVFNLGTGRGYSVVEMVGAFEKASGMKIPYKFMPRRDGDVAECYADVSKARDVLNWEAKLGINDMCKDAWKWQSQNPDGFRD